MATCDSQALLDSAACFNVAQLFQLRVMQAQLLCNINKSLDPMATCDPQTLLSDAKCFFALSSFQLEAVIAQLLCNISGSIVNALPLCGVGSPEGVVTGQVCGQLYTDTATGNKYTFTGTVGTKIGWA